MQEKKEAIGWKKRRYFINYNFEEKNTLSSKHDGYT